jgi:CheB methylesterase
VSAILPVVAMVASAGGLDAFKAFPGAMPANNGMAFVLIPHLDPRHESLIVQRRPRLRAVVQSALKEERRVDLGGIRIKPGGDIPVHLIARPLRGKGAGQGLFLVTLQEVLDAPGTADGGDTLARVDESPVPQPEYEPKAAREELQSTIEELESGNGELKVSNERSCP